MSLLLIILYYNLYTSKNTNQNQVIDINYIFIILFQKKLQVPFVFPVALLYKTVGVVGGAYPTSNIYYAKRGWLMVLEDTCKPESQRRFHSAFWI